MTETIPPAEAGVERRTWPKPWLLQLYAEAVSQGCIIVHPISPADAKSLTQTFYRLRRRVDAETRTYILPEYQLVTVSRWYPANGGSIDIIFNRQPDDQPPLPMISTAPSDHIPAPLPTTTPAPAAAVDPVLAGLELEVSDIDPADFVKALRKSAAERSEPDA